MKFLIVGRSGSGKDRLVDELVTRYGLRKVKSCTTRSKRRPEEDGYVFLSESQADEIADRFAETKINGYRYFTTKEAVENADVFIVDPKGVWEIVEAMPGTAFTIVYIDRDADKAKGFAIKRASDPVQEEKVWKRRIASEGKMFSDFEDKIAKSWNGSFAMCDNWQVIRFYNDFSYEPFESWAKLLARHNKRWMRTAEAVKWCMNEELFVYQDSLSNEVGFLIDLHDGRGKTRHVMSMDVAVGYVLEDDKLLGEIAKAYFGR